MEGYLKSKYSVPFEMDRYDWYLNVWEYSTKMYYHTVMDLEVNQWRYMDIGDVQPVFRIKSDR